MCFQVLPDNDDGRWFLAHAVFLTAAPSPLVGESGRRHRPVSILGGECPGVGAQSTENPVSFEMGDCSRTHAHARRGTRRASRKSRDDSTLAHLNSTKRNNGLLSHASRVSYRRFTIALSPTSPTALPTPSHHGELPLFLFRPASTAVPTACLSTRSQQPSRLHSRNYHCATYSLIFIY